MVPVIHISPWIWGFLPSFSGFNSEEMLALLQTPSLLQSLSYNGNNVDTFYLFITCFFH